MSERSPERSVAHATFTIERRYAAAPARVFKAFEDPVQKRRWFVEGEGWAVESFETDFRVGGFERSRFRFRGGPLVTNDTVYQDIVADRRIIVAYGMTVGGNPISASLATMQFEPDGKGTRLVFTEQGAILDGYDDAGQREHGCRELLEALARELDR
jgi:uncharacterized protein YndB with AHSA1/START domain